MKKDFSELVIRRYVTWITRHPYLVMVSALIITVLLASQIRNLRIELDPDRLLPKEHPMVVLGDKIS